MKDMAAGRQTKATRFVCVVNDDFALGEGALMRKLLLGQWKAKKYVNTSKLSMLP